MKRIKMTTTVTLIIASAFSLSACVATPMPSPAPGALAVNILPATDVKIVQTSARQDRESVVVDGKIGRKLHRRMIPNGHIDIDIIDEKGKTIHQTFTSYWPEIIPRAEGRMSSFIARIPVTAPQGSLVNLKFHSGPHDS